MKIKLFVAMQAFIVYNNKILILRESKDYESGADAGKWGVVGGRIKPGERFDEGLLREIKEETGLNVTMGKPFFINEWRPFVKGEQWQIVGTSIECFTKSNKIVLSKDHDKFEWIDPKDYKKYNFYKDLYQVFEGYLNN